MYVYAYNLTCILSQLVTIKTPSVEDTSVLLPRWNFSNHRWLQTQALIYTSSLFVKKTDLSRIIDWIFSWAKKKSYINVAIFLTFWDTQTETFKLQVWPDEEVRNICLIQTKSRWEAASWILHSKHCHLSCSTYNVTPIRSNNEIFQVSFFFRPLFTLATISSTSKQSTVLHISILSCITLFYSI